MWRFASTGLRALVPLVALGLGCGGPSADGLVEVSWQIDDSSLTRLFPQGELPDTCALPSMTRDYDLLVRLRVTRNRAECETEPASEACLVHEELFDCHRYRGTALSVPASGSDADDSGYLMFVDLLIDPTDTAPFEANSTCVQGPGPRVRSVKPGRLTDLEVYQFVFSAFTVGGAAIDLDACRPIEVEPDPTTTGAGESGTDSGTETGP